MVVVVVVCPANGAYPSLLKQQKVIEKKNKTKNKRKRKGHVPKL